MMLMHEWWVEGDDVELGMLVLAGPACDEARATLSPNAKCVWSCEAMNRFDAMTALHKFLGREPFIASHEMDHWVYADENGNLIEPPPRAESNIEKTSLNEAIASNKLSHWVTQSTRHMPENVEEVHPHGEAQVKNLRDLIKSDGVSGFDDWNVSKNGLTFRRVLHAQERDDFKMSLFCGTVFGNFILALIACGIYAYNDGWVPACSYVTFIMLASIAGLIYRSINNIDYLGEFIEYTFNQSLLRIKYGETGYISVHRHPKSVYMSGNDNDRRVFVTCSDSAKGKANHFLEIDTPTKSAQENLSIAICNCLNLAPDISVDVYRDVYKAEKSRRILSSAKMSLGLFFILVTSLSMENLVTSSLHLPMDELRMFVEVSFVMSFLFFVALMFRSPLRVPFKAAIKDFAL